MTRRIDPRSGGLQSSLMSSALGPCLWSDRHNRPNGPGRGRQPSRVVNSGTMSKSAGREELRGSSRSGKLCHEQQFDHPQIGSYIRTVMWPSAVGLLSFGMMRKTAWIYPTAVVIS
jgi:hypothetical protein